MSHMAQLSVASDHSPTAHTTTFNTERGGFEAIEHGAASGRRGSERSANQEAAEVNSTNPDAARNAEDAYTCANDSDHVRHSRRSKRAAGFDTTTSRGQLRRHRIYTAAAVLPPEKKTPPAYTNIRFPPLPRAQLPLSSH